MRSRPPLSKEDLATGPGRARAWRELMLDDHHVLRLVYRNVHEIDPGRMWRSYQPSPRDLAAWKKKGIKTVVNLRGRSPAAHCLLEEEACDALGLAFVPFQVYSRDAPSKELLHGAHDLFGAIEYPAIMHCKSGADRVGLMSALYMFFIRKSPFAEAMDQLSWRYGHVRAGKTGVLDHALGAFPVWAREAGRSSSSIDDFFEWVDAVYDPAAAKRDFIASWWGALLTERILRRE